MQAREIPLETWSRRETFALFAQFQKPQYAITSRLDVTDLLNRCTQTGASSYLACIHAIGAALHAVPELSTRIRAGRVVQHDRITLSPTLQFPDGRLGFAYLDWQADRDAFTQSARANIAQALADGRQKDGISGSDGVAFLSCLPWLDFTAIDNPARDASDSIPRISWGRYTPQADGRTTMAVGIQAHHGLVDGFHLGQFFTAMQAAVKAG